MEIKENRPVLSFASAEAWESWLDEYHQDSEGIWLKIAKKESGISTVSYAEALDSALCYGWIDGQKGAYDDSFWLQKFTPRGPRSQWSRINREKAEALIAQGRMRPAGLRQVEAARADGRWERAYESQRSIEVPEDFQAALDANPQAQAFFDGLDRANRYAFLYRIQTAKKSETRAARIEKYIEMLVQGQKFHP